MICLNGREVAKSYFPNGETNFGDTITFADDNMVYFRYESDGDLVRLMMLKKHLDSKGVTTHLTMAYMPYSRQDRVEGSSVFTLKYAAEFINSLGFKTVVVSEPHSDVTMALLNNAMATYPSVTLLPKVMDMVGFDKMRDWVVYPDAGAAKRYNGKVSVFINQGVGNKQRNFGNGKITKMEIKGSSNAYQGRKVIIVDDLCSRGGTFIMAAEALKAKGAVEVYVLVTHCEWTVFDGELLSENSPVDKLFCTDSIVDENYDHPYLHIFKGGIV